MVAVTICSLEGMMLKLKLQYFGHLMQRADSLEKTLMLQGIGGRRRRGQQRTLLSDWTELNWWYSQGMIYARKMTLKFSHKTTFKESLLNFQQNLLTEWLHIKLQRIISINFIIIPYLIRFLVISVKKYCIKVAFWHKMNQKSIICHKIAYDYIYFHNYAYWFKTFFSSVQFSRSVVSDSWQHHESQHARPPYPSPSPGVHSNSCPSSQWFHPALSSSVVPISSCPQPFPASESFPMRWPKYWSFSFSIIPSKEIPGLISFRMDWLDLLAVQGTLKSLLQHESSKASILQHSVFFTVQLSHPYMTTGKTIALTYLLST